MMKIVIASDSYKGCMSSKEVANIVEKAANDVSGDIEVVKILVADGGEGFVEAMIHAKQGKIKTHKTVDALLNPKVCKYGVFEDTVVIEVAQVIGLKKERGKTLKPGKSSSFGVGLLIKGAIEKGYEKFIIGLGGSSTNDGGMGILCALGVEFFDSEGFKLNPSAENLSKISKIDSSLMLDLTGIDVLVACDVRNKLLGVNGATHVFGPQKGITSTMLPLFEEGMINYCNVIKDTLNIDLDSYVGGGAAGGIGAVLFGFFKANMRLGIELLLEATKFEKLLEGCDLVITGEGQTDAQSLQGKAVFGISKLAKEYNVPTICISGVLRDGYQKLYNNGVIGAYSILKAPSSYPQAFEQAKTNLYDTAFSLIKTIYSIKYVK